MFDFDVRVDDGLTHLRWAEDVSDKRIAMASPRIRYLTTPLFC